MKARDLVVVESCAQTQLLLRWEAESRVKGQAKRSSGLVLFVARTGVKVDLHSFALTGKYLKKRVN